MTLPSGVVTFVFSDIEGSTKLWESDPDGMDRGANTTWEDLPLIHSHPIEGDS